MIGDGVVLSELAHHLGGDSCDGFAGTLGALLQVGHCCVGKRDLQSLAHWVISVLIGRAICASPVNDRGPTKTANELQARSWPCSDPCIWSVLGRCRAGRACWLAERWRRG